MYQGRTFSDAWEQFLPDVLTATISEVPSLLGCRKQKQRGLRGSLCRWPSITEWEMHITAQGPRHRNDLHCVEWDIKLYYTIPYLIWVRLGVEPRLAGYKSATLATEIWLLLYYNLLLHVNRWMLFLSLHFNGHFPGEPGLASVY